MISFKGRHFPKDVILMGIRWYISYPLSYRYVEELMEERGVKLDHATVNRWVVNCSPALEANFRKYKKPVGRSWRMDETYVKVKGNGCIITELLTSKVKQWTSSCLKPVIQGPLKHSLKRP